MIRLSVFLCQNLALVDLDEIMWRYTYGMVASCACLCFPFFLKHFILSPLFFDGKTGSKAWYFYLFLRIAVWYMNTLHIIMANILCRIWSMSYIQSYILLRSKNDTSQKHGKMIFLCQLNTILVAYDFHFIYVKIRCSN